MKSFEVLRFVPYAHVADVDASIEFYQLLGLELHSRFGPEGKPFWARMKRGSADLMLALSSGPIDPRTQSILFYLHVDNLELMRNALLAGGVVNRGSYAGATNADFPRSGVLFDVQHPNYMPDGEMRVHDPDGYVLLIGQLG